MSQITEDTPLLFDPTADEVGSSSNVQCTRAVERHQQRCTKAIFILTWHSALLAVFLFVLHLIMMPICEERFRDVPLWGVDEALVGLLVTFLLAGLVSFLNLARLYLWNKPMWLWLNMILDSTITFWSIGFGAQGLGEYGGEAHASLWLIRITQAISCLDVIFGLIHLALFLVRCFLSFSYRPWRGYRNWTFPRGRLSVEFKVQFFRQEDDPETSIDATTSGTGIQAEVVAQRV